MAEITNIKMKKGALSDVIKGADVFIGVSAPGMVTAEMVKTMAKDPIIFAMANPVPEIMQEEALAVGAAVVGTGRSDFANQINNVLAFPGIFRGALDVRASDINDEMKIAAAKAIASLIEDSELSAEYVIPAPFDKRVASCVAKAVAQAAIDTKVAKMCIRDRIWNAHFYGGNTEITKQFEEIIHDIMETMENRRDLASAARSYCLLYTSRCV